MRAKTKKKNMKILICEDEKTLSKVLMEKFERAKYDVFAVMNGDEVLSEVKKVKPDMILLDLIMPKLDGLAVLTLIKKDNDLQDIPVIVLSNLNDDEKIKKAFSLGAVDYLVKSQHPINELVEKVNNYILKTK
jgi:CheY-like chemotaxis protein